MSQAATLWLLCLHGIREEVHPLLPDEKCRSPRTAFSERQETSSAIILLDSSTDTSISTSNLQGDFLAGDQVLVPHL
jgi:hypothetical protein